MLCVYFLSKNLWYITCTCTIFTLLYIYHTYMNRTYMYYTSPSKKTTKYYFLLNHHLLFSN